MIKASHMWFFVKALYTFPACFKKIKFCSGSGRNNALFPPICPKVMKIAQK